MNPLLLNDPPPHIVWFERTWFGSLFIGAIVAVLDLNPVLRTALSNVRSADEVRIGSYILITAITIWFITLISRKRHRWAKWVLVVFVGLATAFQPTTLLPLYETAPGYVWLTIAAFCLQLWSVGLLFTSQSRSWFADQTAMGGLSMVDSTMADSEPLYDLRALDPSGGGGLARSADFLAALIQLVFWAGLTAVAGWYAYDYWKQSEVELNIRVQPVSEGAKSGTIIVTNIGVPVVLEEIRVNMSQRPGCLEKPNKRLEGGDMHIMISVALHLAGCGVVSRIDVTTDKGAKRYDFTW